MRLKVGQHQKHIAVAVMKDETALVNVVRRLHGIGINNTQISVLALDTQALDDAVKQIGSQDGRTIERGQMDDLETLASQTVPKGRPEGEGVTVGGCVGLILGLSVFAIPGLGATLLAAGPAVMVINVLAHTTAGGIGLGMLLGAILDERITEEHREYFRERLESGAWLLVVHGDDPLIKLAAGEIHGESVERVETF